MPANPFALLQVAAAAGAARLWLPHAQQYCIADVQVCSRSRQRWAPPLVLGSPGALNILLCVQAAGGAQPARLRA